MATLTQPKLCGCGCGQAVQGSRQFMNQRHKLRAEAPRPSPIEKPAARRLWYLTDLMNAPRRTVVCEQHGESYDEVQWKPHGSYSVDWIKITSCKGCKREGR